MSNVDRISNEQLLEEVVSGYEFANKMCGIATLMQDVLAKTLIDNERNLTKKTGPYRPHEMYLLKSKLNGRHPGMSTEEIGFMQDSIDFYLESLEDSFPISEEHQPEEPTLDELQLVVLEQMLKQERFELMLGSTIPAKTPQ